jgi:formylglycine-generating enzyme required for sulfatase activity
MGNNPSFYQEGNDYPVEEVNWNDVQEFCDRLNAATGKQYRLPTEAEWEYAARGGIYGRAATKPGEEDFLYSGSDTLGKVAWYGDISGRTHPVMKKDANELGLYDMSGNVWELCSDWYDLYPIKPQVNPQDPNNGYNRVARGGSWSDQAEYCRVACRLTSFSPLIGSSILGFRLALSASLPSGNNAG